jgi:protein-arginine kinase activator protein McsA
MTTFDNEFLVKTSNKFVCKYCNYVTSRKYNIELHNQSKKHKNAVLTTFDNDFLVKTSKQYECQYCDKSFNDRAGLWRHKKKCTKIIKNIVKETVIDKTVDTV